jgi:predicted nucleic acid-binding protein
MIILNSSPIIHLTAALGGLDLLPELYGGVAVPAEVLMELEFGSDKDEIAADVKALPNIDIVERQASISRLLTTELDLGEAAVIQLALDTPGATVVLDDLKARRVARRLGLPITGSLGVLLHAKRAGKLDSVRDAIVRLRARGAWLSEAVAKKALKIAGEEE